ncbi:acyltransferase family protein [Acinetobacter baumannii]
MQEITLTSIVLTICLSVCVFLATLCFRKVSNNQLYDSLDRSSPLDAMRGILALSVMTHHFYITYIWKTQGLWQKPANHYLDNLGAVSVSLFFLTTGFLFLNKIRKQILIGLSFMYLDLRGLSLYLHLWLVL